MKKVILFFMTVFFTVSFFTSCEEQEEPQLLSDFVIGEWQSQEVNMGDTDVIYLADIEENHYTLSVVPIDEDGLWDWNDMIDLPDAGYETQEPDVIIIDEPTFPGEEPSEETVTFTVTWVEGGTTMTWTPATTEDDAPTIIWTLQTGS